LSADGKVPLPTLSADGKVPLPTLSVDDKVRQGPETQQNDIRLQMSINSVESTLNTLVCQVNYLASNINNLNNQISNIAESNESFRHQLYIEEALRNQETDIRLLKTKIEKTIETIQKN
jgi:predicted  nucleic acid-binding Zn-ribbon protein